MKAIISSLEEVPENLRGEYEPKNGKFQLKVEGDYPPLVEATTKVNEFRTTNVNLLREIEPLRVMKLEFDGIDAKAAKDAIAKVKTLGDKGITSPDDFEARVRTVAEDLVKPLREQLATSTAETVAERSRANDFLIQTTISDAFIKAGGKAKATDFVVGLGKGVFEVKDGKVVAKPGKFSTDKPGEVLGMTEWLGQVAKDHDYVLEPSKGGGATNQNNPGQTTTPVLKEGQRLLKNPTPQELGAASADIVAGKVKVVYETATAQ